MKVVIIGSGNVATVLGKVIHNAGHEIVQVLSRNENHAKALAQIFNCPYGSFKSTSYKEADIYLLAITDTALYHLDQYVQLGNKLVVHTAGSVSKEVLKNVSSVYGIIYPLQSLIKDSAEVPEIPLLVDGNNAEVTKVIHDFSKTLSPNISVANDQERLKFHVAAVLVNNFTNHLFAVGDEFCKKEKIDFKKLYPLIDETINRVKNNSPQSVQTGPAIREDIYTLGKHLQILSAHPDLKYLYLKLSESILKLHQKK
ncbi:MAG: F420-dependent NADP oxidoreductase [Bacteroidota bacterium]|nr:F420-dependent NADP oxidoreductase [Bacteroidota bacterium]